MSNIEKNHMYKPLEAINKFSSHLVLLRNSNDSFRYTRMGVFTILLLIGTVWTIFNIGTEKISNSAYITIPSERLSIDLVDSILYKEKKYILHRMAVNISSEYDTIKSLSDYSQYLEKKIHEYQGTYLSSEYYSHPKLDRPLPQLPKFGLSIQGTRIIDSTLIFTIIGYQDNIDYQLNFGNGTIIRANEHQSFTYNRTGTYTIKLIASSKDYVPSTFDLEIRILHPYDFTIAADELLAARSLFPPDSPKTNQVPIITDLNSSSPKKIQPVVQQKLPSKVAFVKDTSLQAEFVTDTLLPNLTQDYQIEMPSYPGNEKGLKKYLKKNLIYPIDAMMEKIEGSVYVKILINEDGYIEDADILQGLGYGCDAEALRLVNNMPDWKPAKKEGESIDISYILMIPFKLP